MPDLYPDVPCSSCGKSHTLCDFSCIRRPDGSKYSFRCPTTNSPVTIRLAEPQPVILAQAGAVPVMWVSE